MGGGGVMATSNAERSAAAPIFQQLVGHKNFVRNNPLSDKFAMHKFHHVEFYTADASNTYNRRVVVLSLPEHVCIATYTTANHNRFAWGLGMQLVAKSDQSTGNSTFASYVLRSNDLIFTFTAPYGSQMAGPVSTTPQPWFDQDRAFDFLKRHGLAVRAVGMLVLVHYGGGHVVCVCSIHHYHNTGILVDDAAEAHAVSVQHGAVSVTPPTLLQAPDSPDKSQMVAEVLLYGDVVLRYVSGTYEVWGGCMLLYTPCQCHTPCVSHPNDPILRSS